MHPTRLNGQRLWRQPIIHNHSLGHVSLGGGDYQNERLACELVDCIVETPYLLVVASSAVRLDVSTAMCRQVNFPEVENFRVPNCKFSRS